MTRISVIQHVDSVAEHTGGPARTIRDLAEALSCAGAAVTLVARRDAPEAPPVVPDPALVTTRLVHRRPLPLQVGDLARLFAAASRPGIVHDNGVWLPANIAAATAARRAGHRLVISPHGMLEPWAMAYRPYRKQLAWQLYQRRLLAGADGLVATAASELAAVRALVPRVPIALIPNGVPCPAAMPDRSARRDARQRNILFLSRLHPKKNLPGLLDAWARVIAHADLGDWTLVIAGPDELGQRALLEAQAQRLGIDRRLRFAGAIAEADKATILGQSDLFILPTFSENFGIVVAEALAHGVPAIVTTGAPWQSLVDNACGWHVAIDPHALAGAMLEAMRLTPQTREAMGLRGHAHVRSAFGWEPIAEQMLCFYRWLHFGGARPDFVDV